MKWLGTSCLSSPITLSETPKLPAHLKYKIHVEYVGHTYQSTKYEKSVASFKDQRDHKFSINTSSHFFNSSKITVTGSLNEP